MYFIGDIDKKVDFVKLQAFAPSTRRTRQSQLKKYYGFCELIQLEPFPVKPSNVCRFLVHISETVCYTTLNNYVSALNALSRLRADFVDLRLDYNITLVLRGLRRIKGDATEPMDPLLPEDLSNIQGQVVMSNLEERIIWIIIVTAFRTLLRKSHLVLDRDDTHLLRLRDLSFTTCGCELNIFSSKTIQFKERSFTVPINFTSGRLCAATLLRDFLRDYPKQPDDFLFSILYKGSLVPIHEH